MAWLSLAFAQASLCPHAWNVVPPSSPSHPFLEMQFGSHIVTELGHMDPNFGPRWPEASCLVGKGSFSIRVHTAKNETQDVVLRGEDDRRRADNEGES